MSLFFWEKKILNGKENILFSWKEKPLVEKETYYNTKTTNNFLFSLVIS